MSFKALLATQAGKVISSNLVDFDEADLMMGNVTVAVEYSTVNYKDAPALSGRSPVIRQFPLIPGIDFAGESHCAERFAKRAVLIAPAAECGAMTDRS